jgi:F0F1-type ATP synthase epsilon subunit
VQVTLNASKIDINTPTDLDLHVRSRTTNYFQGKVKSVTSVNDTGEFDVLPMHANFITLVKDYVLLDKGSPTEKRIEFKTAVASIISNHIDIYVGV